MFAWSLFSTHQEIHNCPRFQGELKTILRIFGKQDYRRDKYEANGVTGVETEAMAPWERNDNGVHHLREIFKQ